MRFRFGDYALDTDRRELSRAGEPVPTGPQVFDTLVYLIENRGRVVSKDDLLAAVWHGRIVSESTLTSHMNAVRKAIGDSGEQQQCIRTVARRGVMFVGDVQEEGGVPPPADAVTVVLPDKPSIAVLPFDNLSDDPAQAYFADGMAEEIITALSRCDWLFVIARNSSFTYKGRAVDVRQVGQELGVRYVLEGSVRRAGNRLRFAAQLIEAASGAHIWADRFEGDLGDVFALQDRITESVVAAIVPELQIAEIARIKQKPAASLDAYDLYLRALQLENEFTEASLTEAIACLQRAIGLDPDYARAMALVSYCYVLRTMRGWVKDFDAESKEAIRLANRAIELEPNNSDVLWMAAFAVHLFANDRPRALEIISRSLSINSNAPMAFVASAWIDTIYDPENGIRAIERAQRLNPRDPRAWLTIMIGAVVRLWAGHYADAVSWAERALMMRRGATPLRVLVAAHIQLGQREQAVRALQELLQVDPGLRLSNLHLRMGAVRMVEDKWKLLYESLREAGLPE